MPVYDYKCPKCGFLGAFVCKMSDYDKTLGQDSIFCGGKCSDKGEEVRMVRTYTFSTSNMPTGAGRRMGRGKPKG